MSDPAGWPLPAAIAGVALLAAATSLSGLVVSVVADISYRRANLEHATASLTNVFSSFLLLALLAIVAIAIAAPGASVGGIHVASPPLLAVYPYGLTVGRRIGEEEMREPRATRDTQLDEPEPAPAGETTGGLWLPFLAYGALIAGAGWVVGRSGLAVIEETAISGTFSAPSSPASPPRCRSW